MPSHDFEWEFVRYYNRDQIDAVVIAGKPVLFGGKAVHWDDTSFINQNMEYAYTVASAPEIIRVHGPSSEHRPTFEDRVLQGSKFNDETHRELLETFCVTRIVFLIWQAVTGLGMVNTNLFPTPVMLEALW